MPLIIINLALITLGTYLIVRAMIRIRHQDRLMAEIKKKHSVLAELID